MQPIYVTQTSSGSSPWKLTNWQSNGLMHIGFASRVSGLSSQYQIDITLDDPTGVFPSSARPTVFQSSQAAGGGLATSSIGGIGAITQPIAAWRVTNNSTAGTVTVTALQAGIG